MLLFLLIFSAYILFKLFCYFILIDLSGFSKYDLLIKFVNYIISIVLFIFTILNYFITLFYYF